jgi:hypothetical protein
VQAEAGGYQKYLLQSILVSGINDQDEGRRDMGLETACGIYAGRRVWSNLG